MSSKRAKLADSVLSSHVSSELDMASDNNDIAEEGEEKEKGKEGFVACQHAFIDFEGDMVCAKCGRLVSGPNLVQTIQLANGNTITTDQARELASPYPSNSALRYDAKLWHLYGLIYSLLTRFGLASNRHPRIGQLVDLAYEHKLASRGRKGRLYVGAALLIDCRTISTDDEEILHSGQIVPLSTVEVASALGETISALGEAYRTLCKCATIHRGIKIGILDPESYIERYWNNAMLRVLQEDKQSLSQIAIHCKIDIIELTFWIVHIAKEHWLEAGRKIDCLAMAALIISTRAYLDILGEDQVLTKTIQQRLCELVELTFSTVNTRRCELEKILTSRFSSEIKNNQSVAGCPKTSLAWIIDVHKHLIADKSGRLIQYKPPSLERNERLERVRLKQISQARSRIDSFVEQRAKVGSAGQMAKPIETMQTVEKGYEKVGLIIERLLLCGAAEDEIVKCVDCKQLNDLLEFKLGSKHFNFEDSDVEHKD